MSFRTGLIVVLALTVGLTAAVGVAKYSERLGVGAPAEETVTVVVAVADIPRGTTVSIETVKTREYPKSVAPVGALTRIEDAALRIPRENILKDEPVLETRLAPKGAMPGFAYVIPPGMRVISIKTPNMASVGSGFILPGNKVDVLFTKRSLNANDPNGGGSTTLLVQLVEVLAINQKSDPQMDNKMDMKDLQSATLLVTPEQMLQIDLAQSAGTLTLVLRNENDKSAAEVRPVTIKDIENLVGKPSWDARVKDTAAAVAKAWSEMQDASAKIEREKAEREKAERERLAKEAPKQTPMEAQEQPLVIRTIRDKVVGQVEVPAPGKQ